MTTGDLASPMEIRHLRHRERGADARGKKLVFYLLIAALVSSMVLTYVWTFVKMAEARVRLEQMKRENRDLHDRLDELTVSLARLSNPIRIEAEAKERLKMTLPSGVEYLKIVYEGAPEASADGAAGGEPR